MTARYGLTNWDEVEVKQQSGQRKDLYMRLQDKNNVVRMVTKPYQYTVHRYKTNESDPGFGERIMSSLYHGRDPLMERGLKPKRRWLVGIIDRRTQSYKILDMSVSVFKSIQELVRDEDWGDPTQYDIDIKVDKNGGPTGYYTVIPKSKKPLSAADLDIKSQVDLDDLKRRCTPPTPEQVEELIKAIDAKSASNKNSGTGQAKVEEEDEDEDNVDFPAVDGSDAA